jgi:hypothetical protein
MARDYTSKIPKEQLKDGAYYEGRCRNATVARWNATEQQFYHWRVKFATRFIETIRCPEDEKNFDVFVVDREIETPPQEIPFK